MLKRASGAQKLIVCAAIALCVFALVFFTNTNILTSLMVGWNTFSFSMILVSWTIFATTTSKELCILAKDQDESLPAIFAIVVIAASFSLFGTLYLLINNAESLTSKSIHTIISLLGVALSWSLLHTIFTIRYAHLYFDHNEETGRHFGGLEFPKEENPDYIDFAYFSFVVGMTFQVSDVNVSSRKLRRLVLMHGIISFIFNTIIVALSIATIANLKQ